MSLRERIHWSVAITLLKIKLIYWKMATIIADGNIASKTDKIKTSDQKLA